MRPTVDAVREAAVKNYQRDPINLRIVALLTIVVAETDEAAWAKHDEFLSYANREGALALFGGWMGIDLSQWGRRGFQIHRHTGNAIRRQRLG